MILTRKNLEQYHASIKSFNDRRKKVSMAVFSYEDENGVEYRKKFTALSNTPEQHFWEIAPLILHS